MPGSDIRRATLFIPPGDIAGRDHDFATSLLRWPLPPGESAVSRRWAPAPSRRTLGFPKHRPATHRCDQYLPGTAEANRRGTPVQEILAGIHFHRNAESPGHSDKIGIVLVGFRMERLHE